MVSRHLPRFYSVDKQKYGVNFQNKAQTPKYFTNIFTPTPQRALVYTSCLLVGFVYTAYNLHILLNIVEYALYVNIRYMCTLIILLIDTAIKAAASR
jgi:hypothetical protein